MITEEELQYIKSYIEYRDGKLYCKKNTRRRRVGEEYGTKNQYSHTLGLHLNNAIKKHTTFNRRDVVWMLHNGLIENHDKVRNINGDIYDDRIENLKLEKRPNKSAGRQRGQKDKKPRKVKKILSAQEERAILKQYQSGVLMPNIIQQFNISKSAIMNVLIRHKAPRRFSTNNIKKWKQIDLSETRFKSVGLYAICSFPIRNEDKKVNSELDKIYVGSSVNIYKRCQSHYNSLVKNKHCNTQMQKDFNSGNRVFKIYIIDECEEGQELLLESKYLQTICKSSLYNTWNMPKLDEVLPFLRKAVTMEKFKNGHTVSSDTGCWEVNVMHQSGYAHMQARANGKVKYFRMHRVAYWNKTGEYPELVRHLCNNKKCINPDHLTSGNYRDNSLDNFKEFDQKFEKVWIELDGDAKKITQYFKWEKCRSSRSSDISNQVYRWEGKLGLKEKYPEIYYNQRRGRKSAEQIARKKEQKRLRKEKKLERQKLIESYKEEIITLRLRGWATTKEISKMYSLKLAELYKIFKNIPASSYDFLVEKGIYNDMLSIGWARGIPVPYDTEAESIINEMTTTFPEYKEHIHHYMAIYLFPEEYKQIKSRLLALNI